MTEKYPPIVESALLREAGIFHGFSTRHAPSEPWSRAALPEAHHAAGSASLRVAQTHQVHGARIVEATGDVEALRHEQADALWSDDPSLGVAVRVADCVPLLLACRKTGRVAAVHAGWRGLVAGIVADAVRTVMPDETERGSLLAAIGPCIGVCCFEVGEDVARVIEGASCEAASTRIAGQRPHVDLRTAVRWTLEREHVVPSQIDDVALCTRCNDALLYSYRRDGPNAGRQWGFVFPPQRARERLA